MDAANLLIGVVLLVFGVLGVAYLGLAMIATPLPRSPLEETETSTYPTVDRFALPLMLPVGVAGAVAAVIFFFSQILLAAPEKAEAPIALAIAVLILLASAVLASARRITRQLVLAAIGIPALALVVAGGLSFAHLHQGGGKNQIAAASASTGGSTAGVSAPVGNTAAQTNVSGPGLNLSETTTDNKFSTTSYTIKVGQQVTMVVHNNGQAMHNWHLLNQKSDDGKDIVTTPLLVPPGGTATVTFAISTPGTYKFQCDVHPTEMTGTLTVQ
jgi:plastocyanin